jgi:hypothetical protein
MLSVLLHAPRGLFYSHKAARSRWRLTWKAIPAFCRVVHRTVRCTTGQPLFMSGARSPSISGASERCSSGLVGAPDTVQCTPDSPVHPADRWSWPRVARWSRGRPLAASAVGSPDSLVHHRIVWWILATSPFSFPETDEFVADDSPDSPVIYSHTTPSIPESSRFNVGQPGSPDTVRCATGQSGVLGRAGIGHFFSPSFVTVSSTYTNTLVFKNNVLSLEPYLVIWFVFLSLFST